MSSPIPSTVPSTAPLPPPTSGSVIKNVALVDLVIEPEAQREVDDKRAQKMADDWDPLMVGVITVAVDPTTGTHYIVDGGHRYTGAKKAGLTHLRAEVIYGLTPQQRAKLFLRLQKERKNVNPLTNFNVSITAGEARETEIAACLHARGMKVGGSPSPNVIGAIKALTDTWDDGGMVLVGTTVDVVKAAFSSYGRDAWLTDILRGTALVLHRNAKVFENKGNLVRLVTTLQRRDPRVWQSYIATASGGSGGSGGRPMHMARLLAELYNKGLRSPKNRIAVGKV